MSGNLSSLSNRNLRCIFRTNRLNFSNRAHWSFGTNFDPLSLAATVRQTVCWRSIKINRSLISAQWKRSSLIRWRGSVSACSLSRRLCRSGAGPCGGGNLRRHELLGCAADARNRHTHGAGGAEKRCPENDRRTGVTTCVNGRSDRSGGRFYPDTCNVDAALRRQPDRSVNIRQYFNCVNRCRCAGQLHSGAARHASRSDVCVALPITRA